MPLFVPFAIFLLNGTFVHSETYDIPMPWDKCMHEVAEAVTEANRKAPEGGKVKGGCLPLGDDVTVAPKAPKELTDASPKSGVPLDPIHPENNLKYTV